MSRDAERIVRAWRAAEIFTPRPLPSPDVRENVIDVAEGNPLPWQPGGRLAGRPAGPGKVWRHQVFGGLFALSRVHAGLAGQSALFCCTVSESGTLVSGPAVSECAWAVGQLARGDEAVGDGDPAAWLTASSRDGCLRVSPENLPDFPDGPPTAPDLARFAAELAELLDVTMSLEPSGLRVRSYQVPADADAARALAAGASASGDPPLSGYFAADLASVADAVRESAAGSSLRAFLEPASEETGQTDVRREPLAVRDGCAPDRMPPARWPAAPLVLSEQFAVNEILARHAGALSAVHTPPGSDVTAVFSDLIAAIITERARVLASFPSPRAAFGTALPWGSRTVTPPVTALAGFEILLVAPGTTAPGTTRPGATGPGTTGHGATGPGATGPGLAAIGDTWREEAAATDYFSSTARLAGGAESWAMVRAHLDGGEASRAFVERFWHGTLRGTDALFPAGVSMREALRAATPAPAWPAAVARFRSALAEVQSLSAERSEVSAAITHLSWLEQACEDAYSSLDDAQARAAGLAEREPAARDELIAAEERRRITWEALQSHQGDKPGLVVAVSTGLRAGRDWYTAHGKLRAAFDEATRLRDDALASVQALRAQLADARKAITRSQDTASRLAAEMDTLHAPVATARRRWGDHVPEGPSFAETEDTALIDLRESSAPWADPEFAAARAALFFAALALHKSFAYANADVFEANLAAWSDIVCGARGAPPAVTLAAWQSFFLIVPVVSTTSTSLGSLLSGLGHGSLGWVLAIGAEGVPPRHMAGALWRAHRAVLAGSADEPGGTGEASAQRLASRTTRFGTRLPDGTWAGLPLYPQRPAEFVPAVTSGTVSAAVAPDQGEALRTVLSDLRQRARARRPSRTA